MTLKTGFHGNPHVGLYGFAFGTKCVIGERLSPALTQAVTEALQCTLIESTVAGTPMPGVFLCGNARAVLVPNIAFEQEVAVLRAAGFPVKRFTTMHTCLGNNIIANEHGALVSPFFSDEELAEIASLLKVPVKRIEIAGTQTPGACIVLHGDAGVIHRDAAQHEIDMVKSTLKLSSLERASVNLGSPYLHAGILNSEGGLVVGDLSGGPEIVHLENALNYVPEGNANG
ncbi:hypothetical protein D6789_02290 [Candidatus Woesearchaeota archaeon]|nr:MAG: hypothetical protein D6789_02290 [Candidatus Woesearchaeota archaeon]